MCEHNQRDISLPQQYCPYIDYIKYSLRQLFMLVSYAGQQLLCTGRHFRQSIAIDTALSSKQDSLTCIAMAKSYYKLVSSKQKFQCISLLEPRPDCDIFSRCFLL